MTGLDETEPGKPKLELEEIDLTKFEDCPGPEVDAVNLQCINSTDFVVGKQTTFNGPVTIINYADGLKENVKEVYKPAKEEIVIREKIITPGTVSEMKAFAEKKSGGAQVYADNAVPAEKGKPVDIISATRNFYARKALTTRIIVWTALAVVVIVCVAAYFIGSGDSEDESPVSNNTIPYNGKRYNIVTREEWRARPPLSVVEMKLPVRYVIISHTAGNFCYDRQTCSMIVRNIQGDHLSRSPPYADIAYSFLIGGDGNIYEGRGWHVRDADVGFANGRNINVNFIGSFENLDPPTYPQTEAAKALIEYGVNRSYIDPNYSVISHNATMATLSPGIQLYREIMNWPHFDPNPRQSLKE